MNRCVKSANQIKGHTFKAEVINLIGQFVCYMYSQNFKASQVSD